MKKGQIYEGVIRSVEFPNKAVIPYVEKLPDGTETETKVSVKGGIPGQRVSFAVKRANREKCKGRLLEILEKSPLETEIPICPEFGICGGCSYQTLPYEKQLEMKKEQVLKLIDGVFENRAFNDNKEKNESETQSLDSESGSSESYIYDGIIPSPKQTAYRNKMEFSFGDEVKDGPLTLGLHKKGSFHDILDADCCEIVHEDFRKILVCVRDFCREKKLPFYKKNSHEGILRHLLVRRSEATGEMLAALVVSSQRMPSWDSSSGAELWKELTERLVVLFEGSTGYGTGEFKETNRENSLEGKLAGFLLIINDSLGDVVQSDRTELLYGQDFITEEILGLKFKISPFSFFQTNSKGAEVLYRRARDYILGNDLKFSDQGYFAEENQNTMESFFAHDFRDKVVFDLYSGTGTIAQMIAPIAKKVIGVEIVEEAVEAARENAALNGLTNCEFIAGDVLKVLDEIEEKPDLIILDPPRDGIHPKALPKIIDYGVEQIVYISCKPTSLARDLEMFLERGYKLERLCNVDMFPGTVHCESLCSLSKRN